MKAEQKVIEVKINGKWQPSENCSIRTDRTEIYESLSRDLIAKKLCGCTYIRSITRCNLYDGFVKITVTYDNNSRAIYTVKE